MDNNLEAIEVCPCCGGKLYYKSLDRMVKGGYEKLCIVCMSAIDNINIFEDGAKVIEPYLTKGHGGLYLNSKTGSSLMFLDKDYGNLEYLIEVGNKAVAKGESSLEHSYIYKFNPETNTGEFVWGNYNPLEK